MFKRIGFIAVWVVAVLAVAGIASAVIGSAGPDFPESIVQADDGPSTTTTEAPAPEVEGSTSTSTTTPEFEDDEGEDDDRSTSTTIPESDDDDRDDDDSSTSTTMPDDDEDADDDDSSTSTTIPESDDDEDDDGDDEGGEEAAGPFVESYAISGTGTVTVEFDGSRLSVLSVDTEEGWSYQIDQGDGDEVEVYFVNGSTDVEFEAEYDDGRIYFSIETDES